jgi:branched-chain amino acid transport system ATP-binding protein
MSFLTAEHMTGGYGSVDILHDCTIAAGLGEIAVIVGPNGAGKSTAMKAVFGMLTLREGRVVLEGEDITHLSPQDRVARGMAFVPQNSNVFPSWSKSMTCSRSCATSAARTPVNCLAANASRWP